mgnify:CR=1 FL=1
MQDRAYFDSRLNWKEKALPETKGNIFIRNLILNPIFLNLSFQLKKRESTYTGFYLINLLTSAVGSAIANLDSAPIMLSGIQLNNVFDSQEQIIDKIVKKYKDDAAKMLLRLVGSLDIVGNPVALFENISGGFRDLIEKPYEGFIQGPLEGGKGLVMGAGSLFKNTVSGTMNSLGKVTGSIATGLSSLSMVIAFYLFLKKCRMRSI